MKRVCILYSLFSLLFCSLAFAGNQTMVTSVAEDCHDGPDVAILKEIGHHLNLRTIFQNVPFQRRLIMMENGNIDIVCGLLKNPEREAYIHFVLPPYKKRSDTIFFVPRGRAGRIRTYEDLYSVKIGAVRGSIFFPRFDNDHHLNKDLAHQTHANFRKLIWGRLDAVISNEAAGIDLIHKMGISDQVEMAEYRFSKKKAVYIGISKRSPFMDRLDEIEPKIRALIASGRIGEVLRAYYTRRGLPVPAF